MPERLLATKLYLPPTPPTLVPRSRLLEHLNAGLRQGRRLTLVSAPAGYGKTTLVVEWLSSARLEARDLGCVPEDQIQASRLKSQAPRVAWLSLDEHDNDLARFFAYLRQAFEQNHLETGQITQQLLSTSQPVSPEDLVAALIDDIAANAELASADAELKLVLVLDDYHLIRTPTVHEALGFLLAHQPPQLHLVIITREDPPLALPRLRVREALTEIRADELRFTPQEARQFFGQAGLRLTDDAVSALGARTEGWIAGLHLAALSLRGRTDVAAFIQAFSGSHRYVFDYLVEEVLQQQPEQVRMFLSATAILDRLTAPLCNALTGREDGQAVLAYLEQANLFVVPLDDERRWYRYHHLFADSLRASLDRQRQVALHRAAGHWFEANGLLREAVTHALASEDYQYAGQLIEQVGRATIWSSGELPTLQQWSDVLPEHILRAHPRLCLYYGRALFFRGEHEAAERLIHMAEQALQVLPETNTDLRELRGLLLTNRSTMAAMRGETRSAFETAEQALVYLAESDVATRARVAHAVGFAQAAIGNAQEARQTFAQAVAFAQAAGNRILGLDVSGELAMAHRQLGQLHEARRICERTLQMVEREDSRPPAACTLYLALAMVLFDQYDLEGARQALANCMDLGQQAGWVHVLWRAFALLALISQAKQEPGAALAAIEQAERIVQRYAIPPIRERVAAVRARLWLAEGDVAAAAQWAIAYQLAEPAEHLRAFEDLTLARVRLAQGQPAEAVAVLETVRVTAEASGRLGCLVEALVLQAAAQQAQGKFRAALDALGAALKLAEPQDLCKPFLDAGPAIVALLHQVRHVAPVFVDTLLAAFDVRLEARDVRLEDGVTALGRRALRAAQASDLVEPLSEQELTVLRLLSEGLSNQDIAERLVITHGTAKWHAHNIYAKLGVSGRTKAIARARALKLL